MKPIFYKSVGLFILTIVAINLNAQELVEQYRENFKESFPIRKEQRLELKAYVNKLVEENTTKSLNIFEPNFFSTQDYLNSLYPYREILGDHFGYPPPKSTKGKITKFIKIGEDKYSTIYRVWIEVIEEVHTYGLYMVPKNSTGKVPMLITMHGGGGNPEAICGLDTRVNYHNLGYEAVKRGYIVWAPALNMHSNYSGDEKIPGGERRTVDSQLKQLGTSIIGLEIHKIIESTKTLMAERQEIDRERIGMTGLSWGGFFTLNTTALCPFIKAAAPSAYFRDSEADLMSINDLKRKDPNVYSYKGLGHFQAIGLICPRPCMVQMGENDSLFDMEGVKKEVKRAANIYEKLGVGSNFSLVTHPGGHELNVPQILEFFKNNL